MHPYLTDVNVSFKLLMADVICHLKDDDNACTCFFSKVEPRMATVISASKKMWIPVAYWSADEMIFKSHLVPPTAPTVVRCYGRSGETIKSQAKPISAGFKASALHDRGYSCDAFL